MDLAECAKGELLENANNTCILNVCSWHKAGDYVFDKSPIEIIPSILSSFRTGKCRT